jgi:glycosyltransferase involved in cell wall biosynthesis
VAGKATRPLIVADLQRVLRARPGDVVHTHLPHAAQLGRVAAALARSAAIVDSTHTDAPRLSRVDWRMRLRALARVTDRLIAISETVRRHLVERVGLRAEQIEVVPYGIALPREAEPRSAARARLGVPADAFVVGFVGRLTPLKQVDVLLRAVARVPGAVVAVVGAGPCAKALRSLASELALTDARFTGAVDDAASCMPAFDVLCLPSRWEGLGLVLLEAMARGVPVVGARAGAIPVFLGDGVRGLIVPSGDDETLAAALRAVRDDPAAAAHRAQEARAHVFAHHTVERMVELTNDVYTRALRAAPSRPLFAPRAGPVAASIPAK